MNYCYWSDFLQRGVCGEPHMETLVRYWPLIVPILLLLGSILNAATKHFSQHDGLVRWLSFLSEMLSVVASKGVSPKLKPPAVSRPPGQG